MRKKRKTHKNNDNQLRMKENTGTVRHVLINSHFNAFIKNEMTSNIFNFIFNNFLISYFKSFN
jgi:hypothetical protein